MLHGLFLLNEVSQLFYLKIIVIDFSRPYIEEVISENCSFESNHEHLKKISVIFFQCRNWYSHVSDYL